MLLGNRELPAGFTPARAAAQLSLEADLNHIAALELYRAAEAIDEGHRLVEQKAEAIRSRLG